MKDFSKFELDFNIVRLFFYSIIKMNKGTGWNKNVLVGKILKN